VAHVAAIALTHRYLLLPQLRRLMEEGYEVTAVSAPGPEVRDLERAGIRHLAWPHVTRSWDPAADLSAYRSLLAILGRERFDLVHTHTPKPGVLGRIAARRAGTPCVVNTVHGLYATSQDSPSRRLPVVAVERLAARFSDLELYQSEEDLRWARRIGLVDPRRSALLGNGVDLVRFDPARVSAERVAEVRERLGIPGNGPVVGTVGRLVAEKGYREFIAAAKSIRRARPEVRFLAVGPPDPAKRDAVEASGGHDVVFTGWREDLPELLASMDVFVLASWREGMPRSAIEAAAMGRPLVLTDIRGCREVARHRSEGLLVPRRDPAALSRAILELLGDPGLRTSLGQAARRRAVDRFDERRVCDTLVRQYRRLLATRSATTADVEVAGFGPVRIRAARPVDAARMARLHALTHPEAFLPQLGERFLEVLYRAHVQEPVGVALVAEVQGRMVGYSTGILSTRVFRRRFLRRYALPAGIAAIPRLARPALLRRLLDLGRYPHLVRDLPEAEWTFIALDPDAHARGLGTALGREVLRALEARGAREVKTFVARDNEASNRMVRRLGFEARGEIAMHDGRPSNVYVVRCHSS
jgi:glycosyltransferase involved in cell wall biosynthesis/ribosomal protein S18 acetylase RimI-like enzyme